MAWDISDYKLENLGADVADPAIDWEAIAKMIADKEAAAKETAESENPVPLIKASPKPVDMMAEMTPSLPEQLRRIADQIEGT
jgi:hypothetical protein